MLNTSYKQKFIWIQVISLIKLKAINQNTVSKVEGRSKVYQDEKDCNPIYKIIYSKIRNLNKKLNQLNQLESQEKKTLNQAQLAKLSKKDELVRQIARQQDFIGYYKQIMIENHLVYDKVDDLIKISTFLTIGKRIEQQGYCPDQTKEVYNEIYEGIFKKSIYNGVNQLSDEIIRVYRLLETYLEKREFYSQCRDYMTYIKQIDQKSKQYKPDIIHHQFSTHQIMDHVGKINQCIKGKEHLTSLKLDDKVKKLVIIKQVVQYQRQKQEMINRVEDLKVQIKRRFQISNQFQESVKFQKKQACDSTQPDIDENKKDILSESIEEEQYYQEKKEKDLNFGKKREDRQNNSEDKHWNSNDVGRSKKKRNYKKNNFVQVENIRKCSEASLQQIPERYKQKKVKYVEKKE